MPASPLIVIPARYSHSASAHRYAALSTARTLSEGVLRAGGEPLACHPWAPDGAVSAEELDRRLGFADGVLLPGGGDVSPGLYGEDVDSDTVYDVDDEQDAFDLAVARWALDRGVPLLAVCRGWQLVNVALGGDLEQDMTEPHRHVVHPVDVVPGTLLAQAVGTEVVASCYHHQRARRLGSGLEVAARATDGTIEGSVLPGAPGWFVGVQWHPEDTVATDPVQLALFGALVEATRERLSPARPA
jgi:putative glutamine amidotransferase